MENSPSNSIEKQIDNFLEHFKRSASKAMDADWCGGSGGSATSGGSGASNASNSLAAGLGLGVSVGAGSVDGICSSLFSVVTATTNGSAVNQSPINQTQQQQQPLPHPLLQRTKSRSSCLDISDLSETCISFFLPRSNSDGVASLKKGKALCSTAIVENGSTVLYDGRI
ncbi:uncharacterized protein [Eurosta solidaginis]|uniref:uncharacterized protein n=1 Tax=Eurosta solidaginis TaxID=178769 RepID=UPI00353164F6